MSASSFSSFRRDSEIAAYLNEIQGVPLLAAEQERELAIKAKKLHSSDEAERLAAVAARERFIKSNLRLVVSIAKGFVRKGLPLADLVAEGNVGLLRAVERFDPRRNCRFSTYATWWIRQSIRRALVNTSRSVRVPSHIVEIVSRWKSAQNEAFHRLGRAPELHEAGPRPLGERETRRLRHAIDAAARCSHPISLDALAPHQEIADAEGPSSPEAAVRFRNDFDELHGLLRTMNPREASILRFRFGLYDGEPMTLGEVGRRLHITRERVRQLERAALGKLQARMAVGEGRSIA